MYIIPIDEMHMSHIEAEVDRIPLTRMQDNQGHTEDGSTPGWLNGLSLRRIYVENDVNELQNYPNIYRAVAYIQGRFRFAGVRQILINKLDAGKSLLAHKDGPPNDLRFHLPVVTSFPGVTWKDEIEGELHMRYGHWHGPVNYCGVFHEMHNKSELDRTHIVADFYRESIGDEAIV